MRSLLILLLLLSCYRSNAAATESPPVTFNLRKHVVISEWVSKNWTPTQSTGGDITGDGLPDMAVVLLRTYTTSNEPEYREGTKALAIFIGHESGEYRLRTLVSGMLPCLYCLGTVAGIPELAKLDLEIEDHVLEIGWLRGHKDTEMASVRLRIGYDRESDRFKLLSDETLTIKRIGQQQERRLRNYQTGEITTGDGTHYETPRFIPLEEIDPFDF